MASTAKLSSKFQILVPKMVREELHWEAEQEFVFIPKGKGVLLMPVPAKYAADGKQSIYRTRCPPLAISVKSNSATKNRED